MKGELRALFCRRIIILWFIVYGLWFCSLRFVVEYGNVPVRMSRQQRATGT